MRGRIFEAPHGTSGHTPTSETLSSFPQRTRTFDSAAVHHEDAILDGDGRLGDIGGHHDFPNPHGGHLEDSLLVSRGQRAVQGIHPGLLLRREHRAINGSIEKKVWFTLSP